MISDYKAVFFDAGGTLLHPYPSVGIIYSQVAAKHGCKADPDELNKLFREIWRRRDGMSGLESHNNEKKERDWWRSIVVEVFDHFGGVPNFEEFFLELYEVFGSPDYWRLYPGVKEILGELKKRKKRLAIVSNWDSRLLKLCKGFELEEYFEFILASAIFGASKPGPKIFNEALKRMGIQPHEAVHIGDSYEDDIKGAMGVGINAILIDWHHSEHDKHLRPAHPHMIKNLKELI